MIRPLSSTPWTLQFLPRTVRASRNAVGEAMACGTPCVVTDVGDSATIVKNRDLVVSSGDPETLATCLLRLIDRISGHEEQPFQDTRQQIVNNFSLNQMINRSLKYMEDLEREPNSSPL